MEKVSSVLLTLEHGISVELNQDSVVPETGPETISRFLSGYGLGDRLRRLRLRKKIALTDLSKHTGLSPSMLSQLENGRMTPTLPTLSRIAMVFDVGLDYFFSGTQRLFSIVRAGERMRFPERADSPSPAYFFECLAYSAQGKALQAYIATFPRREENDVTEHFHEGTELIYVLSGVLGIRYQGEEHVLRAGDSLHMDAVEPHGYRGVSEEDARAIVVTLPPRL